MGSPTIITAVKTVPFYTKQSNTDRSQHIAHQREVNFLLPNFEINMVNGWIRGSLLLPTNIRQLLPGVHISQAQFCRSKYIYDFSA